MKNLIFEEVIIKKIAMSLHFDLRGSLQPSTKINLSISEFQNTFVLNFPINSTRYLIFEKYLAYLNDFKCNISEDITQWIDGSFVTNKVNPKDIDFVTLIDYEVYTEKRAKIDTEFRLKNVKVKYDFLDAYTVELFPEGHINYFISQSDCAYWYEWFNKTKKNRAKKTFQKGFIEIKFSKNDGFK